MSTPHLPQSPDANDGESTPEVRLELTRAGVQEVLSLYSQEQRSTSGDSGFTIRLVDVERAIRERRRLLLGAVVTGIVLAAIVILASTPLYPVSAQVVLERYDMTRAESAGRNAAPGASFVSTQAEVMQSDSVVRRAATGLARPAFLDDDDDVVAAALEAVQASPVSGTQIVALGYLGPDAAWGVSLIEAIVESYRTELARHESTLQREKLDAKQAEIDVLEAEAEALETRLAALRREKGTFGTAEDTAETQSDLLRELTERITETRSQRIALENRLATGNDQLAILDPAMRTLQERLWEAEAELARVRLSLTARHPAVEAAQREVTVLRRQLNASAKATPEALERDIAATRGLEAQLQAVYDEERAKMSALEIDRREESLVLAELERVRGLADTRRAELLDQRLLTRLAERGEVGVAARLIAPPTLPSGPVWPRPLLLLAGGAGLGLVIGFALALLAFHRERELAEEAQAEAAWVAPDRAGTPTRVGADPR